MRTRRKFSQKSHLEVLDLPTPSVHRSVLALVSVMQYKPDIRFVEPNLLSGVLSERRLNRSHINGQRNNELSPHVGRALHFDGAT